MVISKFLFSLLVLTLVENGSTYRTSLSKRVPTLPKHNFGHLDLLDKRAQGVLIGYRRVHPLQAKEYRDAGTLVESPNVGGSQLGDATYTANERGGWQGSPGDIDCAVFANPEAFWNLRKAWIPRSQWWDFERMDKYIKGLDSTCDPARTVRMSDIDLPGPLHRQMAIPQSLLNSNGGGLGIEVECEDPENNIKLKDYGTVDYYSWPNVMGEEYSNFLAEREFLELSDQAWEIYAEVQPAFTEGMQALDVQAALAATEKIKSATEKLKVIVEEMGSLVTWIDMTNSFVFNKALALYGDSRYFEWQASLGLSEKILTSFKQSFEAAAEEFKASNSIGVISKAEGAVADMRKVAHKARRRLDDVIEKRNSISAELQAGYAPEASISIANPKLAISIAQKDMAYLEEGAKVMQAPVARLMQEVNETEKRMKQLRESVEGSETATLKPSKFGKRPQESREPGTVEGEPEAKRKKGEEDEEKLEQTEEGPPSKVPSAVASTPGVVFGAGATKMEDLWEPLHRLLSQPPPLPEDVIADVEMRSVIESILADYPPVPSPLAAGGEVASAVSVTEDAAMLAEVNAWVTENAATAAANGPGSAEEIQLAIEEICNTYAPLEGPAAVNVAAGAVDLFGDADLIELIESLPVYTEEGLLLGGDAVVEAGVEAMGDEDLISLIDSLPLEQGELMAEAGELAEGAGVLESLVEMALSLA